MYRGFYSYFKEFYFTIWIKFINFNIKISIQRIKKSFNLNNIINPSTTMCKFTSSINNLGFRDAEQIFLLFRII